MALGFKEKRDLQKIVAEKQTALTEGGLGFKDKREAQKAMQDALSKLNAAVDAGKTSPKLQELLDGKYDNEPPLRFLKLLEDVVKELDGDVQPVKPKVVDYIKKNQALITESVVAEDLSYFHDIANAGE